MNQLIKLVIRFSSQQDEEEAGLLELLKSQICDNAALYAQKYDEEFQPYLPRFVTAIWNLLVSAGQEVKYDLVRLLMIHSCTLSIDHVDRLPIHLLHFVL